MPWEELRVCIQNFSMSISWACGVPLTVDDQRGIPLGIGNPKPQILCLSKCYMASQGPYPWLCPLLSLSMMVLYMIYRSSFLLKRIWVLIIDPTKAFPTCPFAPTWTCLPKMVSGKLDAWVPHEFVPFPGEKLTYVCVSLGNLHLKIWSV